MKVRWLGIDWLIGHFYDLVGHPVGFTSGLYHHVVKCFWCYVVYV